VEEGEPDGAGDEPDGAGDDSGGVSDGEADGADDEATMVAVRSGDGEGSAATRMPQPASSVAAPAAASTIARHLGLTPASSALAVFFAAASVIPPGYGDALPGAPEPPPGCRLPPTGVEETGVDGRQHGHG
jgi:hypothetical protein